MQEVWRSERLHHRFQLACHLDGWLVIPRKLEQLYTQKAILAIGVAVKTLLNSQPSLLHLNGFLWKDDMFVFLFMRLWVNDLRNCQLILDATLCCYCDLLCMTWNDTSSTLQESQKQYFTHKQPSVYHHHSTRVSTGFNTVCSSIFHASFLFTYL